VREVAGELCEAIEESSSRASIRSKPSAKEASSFGQPFAMMRS
jgi:hypothetical protein